MFVCFTLALRLSRQCLRTFNICVYRFVLGNLPRVCVTHALCCHGDEQLHQLSSCFSVPLTSAGLGLAPGFVFPSSQLSISVFVLP